MNSLSVVMEKFVNGHFEEVIVEANDLLSKNASTLDGATCHYLIGCALNELGKQDAALASLLEALNTFPNTEIRLIAHAQDEISRILAGKGFRNSALFFCEMAIRNFDLTGNSEMKAASDALKDELLWGL